MFIGMLISKYLFFKGLLKGTRTIYDIHGF
jgi:hypothetical protein